MTLAKLRAFIEDMVAEIFTEVDRTGEHLIVRTTYGDVTIVKDGPHDFYTISNWAGPFRTGNRAEMFEYVTNHLIVIETGS